MFKKYLLATAGWATTAGFLLLMTVMAVVGAILLQTKVMEQGWVLGALVIVPAVIGAIVQTVLRKKRIAYIDDFGGRSGVWGRRWLLKRLPGGTVVPGDRFWGSKEGVLAVVLPPTSAPAEPQTFADKAVFVVQTKLRGPTDSVSLVTLGVWIVATVPAGEGDIRRGVLPNGFVADELWWKVLPSGETSVSRWLAAEFRKACTRTPEVWEAFKRLDKESFPAFREAMYHALGKVRLGDKLSNVSSMTVRLSIGDNVCEARVPVG